MIAPHGGELIDRVVDAARAEQLRLAPWPRIALDARTAADAVRIATGAYSPLVGFVDARDRAAIALGARLASGVVFPVAITLTVDAATAATLAVGAPATLWHRGALVGAIDVRELVAQDGGDTLVAGPLEVVPAMIAGDTPRTVRAALAARGWRRIAAVTVAGVFGRGDELLTRTALASTDGALLLRYADARDRIAPTATRLASTELVAATYLPGERIAIATVPGAAPPDDPRGALLAAIVAKNHGAGAPVVVADALCDRFAAGDLGLAAIRPGAAVWCSRCELTTARTCPHDATRPAVVDDAALADPLWRGRLLRPEIAALLDRDPAAAEAAHGDRAWARRGFILWFTGLSGAGKSTLAAAVARALRGLAPIEVLDGDEVRTHLSRGLSFSRADRDVNVHRIGFVARTLARHGVGVITAAISPYAATRAEVRALAAERGIPFVEVYARATLEQLIARDVKGLYRQALAGELPHFTGVSDPYEPPVAPELEVATDTDSIETCTAAIVAALRARGLIAGDPDVTTDARVEGRS